MCKEFFKKLYYDHVYVLLSWINYGFYDLLISTKGYYKGPGSETLQCAPTHHILNNLTDTDFLVLAGQYSFLVCIVSRATSWKHHRTICTSVEW